MLKLGLDSYGTSTKFECSGCTSPHVKETVRDDCCPVCLEDGDETDTMLLPCAHQFHGDCILQWVELNFSCPMCRQEINQFLPLNGQTLNEKFVELWNEHYVEGNEKDVESANNLGISDDDSLKKQTQVPLVETIDIATIVEEVEKMEDNDDKLLQISSSEDVMKTPEDENLLIVSPPPIEQIKKKKKNHQKITTETTITEQQPPLVINPQPMFLFPEDLKSSNVFLPYYTTQLLHQTAMPKISVYNNNLNNPRSSVMCVRNYFNFNMHNVHHSQILFGSLVSLQNLHVWKILSSVASQRLQIAQMNYLRISSRHNLLSKQQILRNSQPYKKFNSLQMKRHNMSLISGRPLFATMKKVTAKTQVLKALNVMPLRNISTKQRYQATVLQNARFAKVLL